MTRRGGFEAVQKTERDDQPTQLALPSRRAPFWADDFDMDLLTIPGVEAAIAAFPSVASKTLYVRGGTSHGRLNHPAAWDAADGVFTAYFGHLGPTEPDGYCASKPVVECTVEEMLRDAWAHGLRCVVDGAVVFDGGALRNDFEVLMGVRRGWYGGARSSEVPTIEANVFTSVVDAVERLRTITPPLSDPLRVSTARIGTKGLIDGFDITRKSAKGDGLAFAPSWEILRPALDARKQAEAMRCDGAYIEANAVLDRAWREYRPKYIEEMRVSIRRDRGPWDRLLARSHVSLLCYCTNPEQCHRTILARDILPTLGAIYGYEVR